MLKKKNIIIYIILFLSILFWVYRIYPYFTLNIPFWYDPGLYRLLFLDYYNNLPNIDFVNMSGRTKLAYPPFLWIFWNILQIIWISVDDLLSFWLGFFSIITSIFLYLNLKKYSKIAWLFWIIIFFISIIEYQTFWWNYYKQIIWVIFILSSIYLLENKKHYLSLPIIIWLFTIHRPAWVYFLVVFILYKIINFSNKTNKEKKDILIVWLWWFIALLMYIPLIQEQLIDLLKPLLTITDPSEKSWTFFLKEEFWVYNFLIILPSLYGLYYKLIKKDYDYITVWYLVWIIWVWFGLFFHTRMLIFFDIFIILMSAYSFYILSKKRKKIFIILFPLFFIFQSFYYLNYVNSHNSPLIEKIEFENILKINSIIPENSAIMVTHSNYSPWIAGYTYKDTISPWLFEFNKWNLDIWKIWWLWDWKVKCVMVNKLKNKIERPLYIWIWKKQPKENLENADCFEKVILWKNFIFVKVK